MKKFLNKYLPYIVAALTFIALTLVYLYPSLSGKVLSQSDTIQWEGMSHSLKEYNKTVETPANWAAADFSGMPAYQITSATPQNGVTRVINAVDRFFRHLVTLFFTGNFALVIGYFIGFFILLRAFGVNPWLSIIGSIATAMSSYFFLIIPAGHQTKAITLAMMAPVIGGFYLIFRKKYAWGASLVMLFSSIGMMRHPQMSYYMFMMMGLFGIAEIVIHAREKRWKDLAVAVVVFAAAIGIGVGTGYSTLKSNSEYVSESTRGGASELSSGEGSKGLDIDYATAWSYGIDETLTLLIPNYMGGSSNYSLGTGSKMYKELVSHGVPSRPAKELCSNLPTYWGEQPFTAGAVYVGAIVCFLFLLGCLVVKGPYKWALIAATLFSILLSWGHNFEALTELFFYHFPFYSKFRTVSSILVVAEVAMPLLGFIGLSQILKERDTKYLKPVLISAGITAGICLLVGLFGGALCSFSSSYDARMLNGMPEWFTEALHAQRASMLRSDSLRSFFFVVVSAALLYAFLKGKVKEAVLLPVFALLVCADMWGVDKRFFGERDWTARKPQNSYFNETAAEKQILRDPGYFRVFNLSGNAFSESRTSYRLNSVGGYHSAKLRRYQDLIDEHLSKGHLEVADMLNVRYYITSDKNGQQQVVANPDALGAAWLVDEVLSSQSAREECDALTKIDLRTQAVCSDASKALPANDFGGSIELVSHTPDRLVYKSSLDGPKTAVFSEIYYPYGWNAYIDGQKCEYFRADYTLRALNLPAGEHEVVFEFRPESIYRGYKVNAAFKVLMYILIGLGIFYSVRTRKKARSSFSK